MIELFGAYLVLGGGYCLFNCQFGFWQFDLDFGCLPLFIKRRSLHSNERPDGNDTVTSVLFFGNMNWGIFVDYMQWLILNGYRLEIGTV
jgi:hypothetical protein